MVFFANKGMTDEKEKYIIYGGQTGWIGTQLVQICKDKNLDFAIGASRIEDRNLLAQELDNVKPTHVLMAAGLTGRPTVDWCEDHKQDVIRVNVVGVLSLVDLCFARGIHVTNFATGCIFKYDENHPIGGCGFAESDMPNFTGSFYSHTKVFCYLRETKKKTHFF
jgi:dTDP-4-dehydrorhamnose reductase